MDVGILISDVSASFWRERVDRKKKLSAKEKKEVQKLTRRALDLWRLVVKERAGRICEAPGCNKKKFLNAHHIESYTTNKGLRFDPENGFCGCPGHHKFKWVSAHKSFCFLYEILISIRIRSLLYLLENYKIKVPVTKEFLEQRIRELGRELRARGK